MKTFLINETEHPIEEINRVFESVTHQIEVFTGLYRILFPKWDNILSLHPYPKMGKEISEYIWEKVLAFDKEHHPEAIAGGLWMNKGFSTNRNLIPNQIVIRGIDIEYG